MSYDTMNEQLQKIFGDILSVSNINSSGDTILQVKVKADEEE